VSIIEGFGIIRRFDTKEAVAVNAGSDWFSGLLSKVRFVERQDTQLGCRQTVLRCL